MIVDALLGRHKGDLLAPHFSFRRAQHDVISPDLYTAICTLRYEAYCLECGFLDPADYQHGLECDEFEHRSTYAAAYNMANDLVGTVRLVRATPLEQIFPWELHCQPYPGFALPDPLQSAEVSRLVVHKHYRRRTGDSREGIPREISSAAGTATISASSGKPTRAKRRSNAPQILLGMYRELYRYSRVNGIRYWYAAMERSLANSLDKMGFLFRPVGPEMDYYGPVRLYMTDLDELMARLQEINPLVHAWFNDIPITRWMLVQTYLKSKCLH